MLLSRNLLLAEVAGINPGQARKKYRRKRDDGEPTSVTAIPKPVRHLDRHYMDWVKTLRCYAGMSTQWLTAMPCSGPIDPHHVVPAGGGKMGSKVSDRRCIPLCRQHHIDVGKYPAAFKEMSVKIEAEIVCLNVLYELHWPTVLPLLHRTQDGPEVKTLVIKCDCRETHRVPRYRASFQLSGVSYYCGRAGVYKVARWQ